MLQYYERRQPEYEAIYAKPERQADLAALEHALTALVSGRRVLELACGTGYWTRRMAPAACSIHATDASERLATAARASCAGGRVTAGVMDAYAPTPSAEYDCVVAGFFLSHVPVGDRRRFFGSLARALPPGARVVMFDNRYVEGSSTPIARRNAAGDAFQVRELSDGSAHEVLKNFPDAAELEALYSEFCRVVSVVDSRYFWLASGTLGR